MMGILAHNMLIDLNIEVGVIKCTYKSDCIISFSYVIYFTLCRYDYF